MACGPCALAAISPQSSSSFRCCLALKRRRKPAAEVDTDKKIVTAQRVDAEQQDAGNPHPATGSTAVVAQTEDFGRTEEPPSVAQGPNGKVPRPSPQESDDGLSICSSEYGDFVAPLPLQMTSTDRPSPVPPIAGFSAIHGKAPTVGGASTSTTASAGATSSLGSVSENSGNEQMSTSPDKADNESMLSHASPPPGELDSNRSLSTSSSLQTSTRSGNVIISGRSNFGESLRVPKAQPKPHPAVPRLRFEVLKKGTPRQAAEKESVGGKPSQTNSLNPSARSGEFQSNRSSEAGPFGIKFSDLCLYVSDNKDRRDQEDSASEDTLESERSELAALSGRVGFKPMMVTGPMSDVEEEPSEYAESDVAGSIHGKVPINKSSTPGSTTAPQSSSSASPPNSSSVDAPGKDAVLENDVMPFTITPRTQAYIGSDAFRSWANWR